MKKTLLYLMAIAMLASCSDNDNPAPEPEAPGEKWAFTGWDLRYSDEDPGDSSFFRVTYNADSTVKETKEWDKGGTDTLFSYFTYFEGKMTRYETKEGSREKQLNTSYFYKDGKLARITRHDDYAPGDAVLSYDTLIYNTGGKLVQVNYISPVQPEYNNKKYFITWTGENISKVEMHRNNNGAYSLSETEVYTVDNKPNIVSKMLKDDYLFKVDGISYEYFCANNVVKVEMTETGTEWRKVRTATITYNERGQVNKFINLNESFSGTTLNSSYTSDLLFRYIRQ
ncbi:hypothetical protein [Chitinophaga sp. 22620]|uniref:hypothetical protein n=1 Tax=Chitinophaga sp. 22620 TaxID=3453952 RepID=UPI003F875B66